MKQKKDLNILEISVSVHEWPIYRYGPQKKPYRSISSKNILNWQRQPSIPFPTTYLV